ncbi:hypothetical protein LVY72_18285 [Arthrobacter sp. I2-34]|uniref:Cell division protein FtsL n=1 Tax=Arthrobacter hankyongi TaxID=2904801 RepID=A0ABS9LAZ6_9MICC|nr:hypothetical protein [Arthrobacter hankyongi]MCG2623846.1 hypothetical protein [Arthrobacter hankyongi]
MSAAAMNARSAGQAAVYGNAVQGNNARVLGGARQRGNVSPSGLGETRRTPLSLVAGAPARRRVPFVLFCFAVLVAALGCVLMLNISVSGGQYEIVELRGQQVSLEQQNEKLTQQLENHRAPQNLAAEAARLGMVVSPSVGSIDLQKMKVSGQPQAAGADTAPNRLVARPEVPGQASAAAEPAQSGSSKAGKATAADSGQAGTAAKAGKKTETQAPASSARNGQGAGTRKFTEAELNGGTIPAPQQRAGQ